MTRPKVDPDKRQRTAQACDSCKRRKQKCNGLKPCQTCSKRNLHCTYGEVDTPSDHDLQSSPKRRMVESQSPLGMVDPLTGSEKETLSLNVAPPPPPPARWTPTKDSFQPPANGNSGAPISNVRASGFSMSLLLNDENVKKEHKSALNVPPSISRGLGLMSRGSTVSGQEEEAVVYSNTRMLQDPTGRLLYIGDSATLSFLQLTRMIIENVAGPSPFTMDPRRHKIVEASITLPQSFRRTHLLPDRQTANVLIESYFTNTSGMIEVFDRKEFLAVVDTCYTDPLTVDPNWLCLMYLTFAIGLVMAAPTAGSAESIIIQKLRAEEVDRAEVFYADAKSLGDPASGFEDAGFWSIQALTLMSVYMLAVSKRNASYAYYGMAVRSAFALGLHREETMCIFGKEEQSTRRNLWRTLFVLDRFLAASLGRPTAIRESDCSGATLTTGEKPETQSAFSSSGSSYVNTSALGLEASVRSCHVIGVILEKVYSQRKISTRLAQDIADHCKGWPKALDPSLHHRQATSASPPQGVAILHVNLLYCHSIILLTRPFFLYLMNRIHQASNEQLKKGEKQKTSRMEKFGEACVIASCHSIALVQNALECGYLPRRNPFNLYFLFAAALIVLSNEFSALYHNPSAAQSITSSINIMHYCAQHDPQAARLLFILTSFRDVVVQEQTKRAQHAGLFQPPISEPLDPMGALYQAATMNSPSMSTSSPPDISLTRSHSNPNISSILNPMPTLVRRTSGHQDSMYPSDPMDMSTTSAGRQNSLDAFFDLARISSQANSSGSDEGQDSLGDAEVDFEALWQWPSGNGGMTPAGGIFGSVSGVNMEGTETSVPLFGMDFGSG